MGFRAKNEIIYSRVYGKTKREFERQMADSGYKNSSDFMEYLLRVNKGKQVDGVTLKEFTDVMKEVAHELKKKRGKYQSNGKVYQPISRPCNSNILSVL